VRIAALAAAAALLPAAAQAREVSGVEVPDSVTLAGKPLSLQGAGLRKRFIVKVYVGALYLEVRSSDPEAVVAADAAKVVRMHFLRDVDREAVLGAFREGFEKNSPAAAAAAVATLRQVEQAVPAEIKKGQVLVVAYAPGAGTSLGVEGGTAATAEGKAFADALFRIWLGPAPADADLKAGMLGK
jgi:hypothetical protein